MREITLSKGRGVAIVDDDDYETVSMYKWQLQTNGYAGRHKGKSRVYLHREILNAPHGVEVDHINGDRLDNRRSNLRLATRSENATNTKIRCDNSSGYRGVWFWEARGVWKAFIGVGGRSITIGYFTTKHEAAVAYNTAAIEYHGEFARLNNVLDAHEGAA